MGIQSDQLVYDYLSRVGDLAQATTLTAAERARLVTTLRQTIDSRRGRDSGSSLRAEKAAMEKILAGIGTPAEVVREAVHGGVPERPAHAGGRAEPRPGPSVPQQAGPPPVENRPGAEAGSEDWWRASGSWGVPELGPGGVPPLNGASIGELPGWRATYEADFLDPDAEERAARVPEQRQPGEDEEDGDEAETEAAPARPRGFRLRRPAPPAAEEAVTPARRRSVPLLETLALLVLVAAAVLGLWYLALAGWAVAYVGRRLGVRINHVAGLWLPLAVAVLCGISLYVQAHGQASGHHLTDAQFQAALRSTTALWLRLASGTSAAFLAWRISRS
jgi:hypothetical protein